MGAEVEVALAVEHARVGQAHRVQDTVQPLAGRQGVPTRGGDLDLPILRCAGDAVTVQVNVPAIRPGVAQRQPLALPPSRRDLPRHHSHLPASPVVNQP